MGSNASATVDAAVNAPSEKSGQPTGSTAIQFQRVPRKQTSDRPQNQRLSNIFQGLISQQLAANDTDNQPKDSKNMPRGENKRKRAATVEDDETEARPAKRTRSAPPSYSSTKAPSTTKAHEDGAAKPILIAEGREYDPARDRDHYIVKDRLIDFLYDVPGWGPNRAVTPLSESYFYIDDEFYNDDEDLMFTMDDLFDFDRYDAP